MSRRSRAREIVLQVLYQSDLNPDQPDDVSQRFINARLNYDRQLVEFAETLIKGVREKKIVLDSRIETTAENWKLSRMPATDRNVLRLGAYEILFTATPDRVAINEAIELAKRYGTKNSAQFVNGILDRLMNNKTAPKPTERPTPAQPPPPNPTMADKMASQQANASQHVSASQPMNKPQPQVEQTTSSERPANILRRPQVVIIDDSNRNMSEPAE